MVAWNFGPAIRGDEKVSMSTFTDPCMEDSELTRGPGVHPQRATYSFAGTWPGCSSMLGAVRQGAFYEFSLKARKGCLFSLKSLALVLRVQPDGPKAYILTYSTDGEHFIDIGAPIRIGPTGNDGKLQKPIDLSAVPELQNVPAKKTITFRLYAWGSKKGSENTAFRIGKSTADRPALAVQGTAWKK